MFELFFFFNQYTNFETYKKYDILEIKLSYLQYYLGLKLLAHELLQNITTMWPQFNESNVKMFMSLLIYFSIEQINFKIDLNVGSKVFFLSNRVNIPSSSLKVALITSLRKIQSPLKSSFPVTLKAYTKAFVS